MAPFVVRERQGKLEIYAPFGNILTDLDNIEKVFVPGKWGRGWDWDWDTDMFPFSQCGMRFKQRVHLQGPLCFLSRHQVFLVLAFGKDASDACEQLSSCLNSHAARRLDERSALAVSARPTSAV